LRSKLEVRGLTLEDVPAGLKQRYTEKSGRQGTIVYVNPAGTLWRAENLHRFAGAIREVRLPQGEVIHGSGDPVIFDDILRNIAIDAPRTSLIALGLVIVIVAVVFRGLAPTVTVIVPLLVGVLWMLAMAGLLGIKLNFFNFVAVPTTFGVAVD